MLQLVNLLSPVLLVDPLSNGVHLRDSALHGVAVFESLLNLVLGLIVQHFGLLLQEDAQNESVYYEPAVAPKQTEQSLHLVERDYLSEDTHDPVLTEDHHVN